MPKLNELNYAVCSVFSFVLFSNPPRSFFRLNHLRKVRKRCSHSRFSFQTTILGVFDRSVGLCCSCFSVANGRRNYLSQSNDARWKKFLISLVFFHFHFHFGLIRDSCWPWRWKYPYKVILSTIQPNVYVPSSSPSEKLPDATTRIAQWVFYSLFTHILVPRGRAPFGQHQESRPLASSSNGSPRFTDFPSLCTCSESSLANLIGSGLNLLCLQIHSKLECRWNWPEVAILGADQKERSLWGREWFTQSLFRNTDRKLLRIMSGFNIKGE